MLRLPALASGLALLAVNFLLCRRAFGSTAAWVSSLILAILPLNIAYSRFAWDASQTVLAVTLLMYFGLDCTASCLAGGGDQGRPRRSLLPPMLAWVAAIWVHPTNLFAGWLLIVPAVQGCVADWGPELARWTDARAGRLARSRAGLGATALLLVGVGIGLAEAPTPLRPMFQAALHRAVDPAEWGLFARLVVRLLSGSTVTEFVAGPTTGGSSFGPVDWLVLGILVFAGFGLYRRLAAPDAVRERSLAVATLAMLVSFFLLAGPAAIAAHAERYGMCLVAPLVLLTALGLCNWLVADAQPPAAGSRWQCA